MLAYMQGGASSPSGAGSTAGAAHVQAAPYTDPLGPAVSSAVDTYVRGQGVAQGARGLGIQEGQLEVAKANSKADIAKKASDIAMQSATAKRIEMETQALNSLMIISETAVAVAKAAAEGGAAAYVTIELL